jgi:tetratricopeptide (TPR) repeat protein
MCSILPSAGAQGSSAVGAPRHPASRADLSLGKIEPGRSDFSLAAAGERHAEALAHYSMALQHEEAGRAREALAHYRELLKADPQNAALAQHAAGLAMGYASRDEALKILRENIGANPQSPEPSLSLVRFLSTYLADDPFESQTAMKVMSETLERFPRSASVYREAVTLHLTAGLVLPPGEPKPEPAAALKDVGKGRAAAAKVLEGALAQDVKDPEFWLVTGRAAQEVWPLGETERREEHRTRVNAFFQRALANAGSSAETRLQVAQYYVMTSQLSEATAICEQLAKDGGNLQARKILYRLHDAAGRKEQALALQEEIVKQQPSDIEQRRLLADAYRQRVDMESRDAAGGRVLEFLEKAMAQIEAVIQLGGGEAGEYLWLARLLQATGKFERALNYAERGIRLHPESAAFHYYAATSHAGLEQYQRAVEHFADAESLASEESIDAFEGPGRFFFRYGIALERLGRFDEAAKRFEKSIRLTPADDKEVRANTLNYLGYMWLERDQEIDKAGDCIRQANELVPDNPAYVDSLGWFHFKKGRYQEALQELLRAESLLKKPEAEDAEIIEHIGRAYEQLGQKENAVEYLRKAAALDPKNEKIRTRLDRMLGKPESGPDDASQGARK